MLIMSGSLTRMAEESLRAFYERDGIGPVEPLAIEGTPMHLVTMETLRKHRSIELVFGHIESPDGITYAVVALPKDFRSPATDK